MSAYEVGGAVNFPAFPIGLISFGIVSARPEMRSSFLPLGARRLSFSGAPTAHPCADGAYAASMPLLRKTTVRRLPMFIGFLDKH
ncbi:MAG: hypothetical protein PVJ68_17920 [Candidatus Thiodiazotropha sp.]